MVNGAHADGEVEPERYARFEERAGNSAMTPDGRLIVSRHPFPYGEAPGYRVVEHVGDGTVEPFPNEDWSTPPPGGTASASAR